MFHRVPVFRLLNMARDRCCSFGSLIFSLSFFVTIFFYCIRFICDSIFLLFCIHTFFCWFAGFGCDKVVMRVFASTSTSDASLPLHSALERKGFWRADAATAATVLIHIFLLFFYCFFVSYYSLGAVLSRVCTESDLFVSSRGKLLLNSSHVKNRRQVPQEWWVGGPQGMGKPFCSV